jgi:hypothetical protein
MGISSFALAARPTRKVARVARSLAYGKSRDDAAMLESGIGRAEAMAYGGARGGSMTEQDWSNIEMRLFLAYRLLMAGAAGNQIGLDRAASRSRRAQKKPRTSRGF